MKTNIVKTAIMAKKQYCSPYCEVVQWGAFSVMKDLGPASLPGEAGAPARKPGKLDGNAPVF